MSNFPSDFDDDTTLPFVNDNITEIGAEAINSVRDAVFNIEQYLGLGAALPGSSISSRLDTSLYPDGTIKPSALTSLGLVTLPINDSQISDTAQIKESKLNLDYSTTDLFNNIKFLAKDVNYFLGWISTTGMKIEPHIMGAVFRHTLHAINVTDDITLYFKNKFNLLRDNSNAYTLVSDINSELLAHQFADGTSLPSSGFVTTNGGFTYPSTHAHTASGLYINPVRFETIPKTINDLQKLSEFIDKESNLLIGTRLQTIFANGIPRTARSYRLNNDGYGQEIISVTPAITYLLDNGLQSSPFDDIDAGDDVIEIKPLQADLDSNVFDSKFALVKIGDTIRVNYGNNLEVLHTVREKKYIQGSGVKKFYIRIYGKNLVYNANATIRIDKPLFNNNKFHVLASAGANNTFNKKSSLIIGVPKGASALGINFNPELLNSKQYNLYLQLYPTGNPLQAKHILPAIDVTGNKGKTPGKYTLDSIIENVNNAFRQPGYNYRFIAFKYEGNFGIALADSYNNAAFSICSYKLDTSGAVDPSATSSSFPNNIIPVPDALYPALDALGFGPEGTNLASPDFNPAPSNVQIALSPTKVFVPLRRTYHYVNGTEIDRFNLENYQIRDGYGDGYWQAKISEINIFPGIPSRKQIVYEVDFDLSNTGIEIGKTLVSQPLAGPDLRNTGRFIIEDIVTDCAQQKTYIKIYDGVHGTGSSPDTTLPVGSDVKIYFTSDSVSINAENLGDHTEVGPFLRNFETYIDPNGKTFTHERARINVSGTDIPVNGTSLRTSPLLSELNIVKVSPKLKAKQYGSGNSVSKISLFITSILEDVFAAYLCDYDDSGNKKNISPTVYGRIGETVRVYDKTCVDFVDIYFNLNTVLQGVNDVPIDIQLYPSLSFDDEFMLINSFQYSDINKKIKFINDERQFGNISEKHLSTSALNYISAGERLLHGNGVIRGFGLRKLLDASNPDFNIQNPYKNNIYFDGGLVLVNGKLIEMNEELVSLPFVYESYNDANYPVVWAVCISDKGTYELLPLLNKVTLSNGFYTPDDLYRKFTAYNFMNGEKYPLEAATFSYIINNRKDLTILYAIETLPSEDSTETSLNYSVFNLTDARRYVNDTDNNHILKLTNANSQGNFKKVSSIFNWIKYNSEYTSVASIKGARVASGATSGLVDFPIVLNFGNTVSIDGQNDAFVSFTEKVTLGSNVQFKNATLFFNKGIDILQSAKDIEFINCSIVLSEQGNYSKNIMLQFLNCNNILFKDCSITCNFPYSASTTSGASIYLNKTTNFVMDNTTVYSSFNYDISTYIPGNVIVAVESPINITNSNFIGNFSQFCLLHLSNDVNLKNIKITTSFNPTLHQPFNSTTDTMGAYLGLSDFTYQSDINTNLVNTGRGVIYSKVNSAGLKSILIDNVDFTYSPTAPSSDRLCFVNFELYSQNSVIENVKITNCNFNSTNYSSTKEDRLPAVAIVNKVSSSTNNGNLYQPLLRNVIIERNNCRQKQSIIVTSKTSSGMMLFPGLIAANCLIKDNLCGTIGYWTSSASRAGLPYVEWSSLIRPDLTDDCVCPEECPNNLEDNYSKDSNLFIDNNNCNLIATLDHLGKQFLVANPYQVVPTSGFDLEDYAGLSRTFVNMCDYNSGNVTISNNKTNWIHVGISYEKESSLQILNNKLSAYDTGYLVPVNIIDADSISILTNITNNIGYAIFVSSNINNANLDYNTSNNSSVIIEGNITSVGSWIINNIPTDFKYKSGIINCQSSNIISNNILKGTNGITASSYYNNIIVVMGRNSIITNNKLYREDQSITSYITCKSLNAVKNYMTGLVVDNYLDSSYTRVTNTNESDVIRLLDGYGWVSERNKNQINYAYIPLTNGIQPFKLASTNVWNTTKGMAQFNSQERYITTAPGRFDEQKSYVLWYHDGEDESESGGPLEKNFAWQEDLSKYLPNNVTILSAEMGVKFFNPLVTTTQTGFNSNIRLYINKYRPSISYTNLNAMQFIPTNLPTPYDLDVKDLSLYWDNPLYPIPTDSLTGADINSSSTTETKYLKINLESVPVGDGSTTDYTPQSQVGSKNSQNAELANTFSISLLMRYKKLAATISTPSGDESYTPDLDIYFSPVLIKYKW